MNEEFMDQLFNRLKAEGFDQIALESVAEKVDQVRFSANTKDLHNHWEEESIVVFSSMKGHTVSTVIKDPSSIEGSVMRLKEIATRTPENPSFASLNPEPQKYSHFPAWKGDAPDLEDLADAMISGALENGAERTAGLLYHRHFRITVKTNYNTCTFDAGGIEAVIRAFRGNFSGQEGQHFGPAAKVSPETMAEMGRQAGITASTTDKISDIKPGKYAVIMSPYVMGNIMTYSSGFLSYYSVETGLSCFADLLGKKVSSGEFTLHDNPLDYGGVGARLCDEEGTATSDTEIISGGVLKNYLHSYSTASRAGARTTGNAGVVSPRSWQLELSPGKTPLKRMMSGLDRGIIINNAWYTRFQDYRNGIFSTVPRDGVFFVENGEIKGNISGIRISDSVMHILENVQSISSEKKMVKWWEEIAPSSMPYVLVDDVNISKAF